MNEYVEKWIKIMEKDNFKSTYQVVFGKAVIEVTKHYNLIEDNDDSDLIIVSKDLIANTMIHLYWKHSYMYRLNLKQGSGNLKILELIDEIIEKFRNEYNGEYGENANVSVYDYADTFFHASERRRHFWNSRKNKIKNIIGQIIIPAFEKCGDENLNLFVEQNDEGIVFRKNDIITLKEHYIALKYIYDYKWAQLLARYNEDFKLNNEMITLIDLRIHQ